MGYVDLNTYLGLTQINPTVYAPTATTPAVAIAAAALPSAPVTGALAIDSGDSNKLKWWDGSAWQTAGGGGPGGSPAGSDTQVQFNDGGAFGASSALTFAKTTGTLTLTGSTVDAAPDALISNVTMAPGSVSSITWSAAKFTVNHAMTANSALSVVYGTQSVVNMTAAAAQASTWAAAVWANVNTNFTGSGAKTLTHAYGVKSYFSFANATGTTTIAQVYAYHADYNFAQTSGTLTISNYYGLFVATPTSTATITNRYGVYVEDAAARNYFAGYLGVGNTPTTAVHIVTGASTSARAAIRIPHGSAPSSIADGDIWTRTTGFFYKVNGNNYVIPFATSAAQNPGCVVITDSVNGWITSSTLFAYTAASGLAIGQSAGTGGISPLLTLNVAAHTALTASTERNEVYFNFALNSQQFATGALTTQRAFRIARPTYAFVGASTITNAATMAIENAPLAGTNATITNAFALWVQAGMSLFEGVVQNTAGIFHSGAAGIGYANGPTGGTPGGTVTQTGTRDTGVTLDKLCGQITLVSAAGSTTPTAFTVTNARIAANDVVIVSQKSGTNKYIVLVTAVSAGSFQLTVYTTGGTVTESPVITFAIIKATV